MTETVYCDFCPVDGRVKATHTYTDPQGHSYRLCQRHYGPIGSWLNKQSSD